MPFACPIFKDAILQIANRLRGSDPVVTLGVMDSSPGLDKFFRILETLSPDSIVRFRPPASAETFARLADELRPWVLPEALRLLYERHDGADNLSVIGGEFLSIDRLIQERRNNLRYFMSAAWLPFVYGGAGELEFVEADTDERPGEKYVWTRGKDYGNEFSYLDVDGYFATQAEALEQGALAIHAMDNSHVMVWYPSLERMGEYRLVQKFLNQLPSGVPFKREFFPAADWPESWLDGVNLVLPEPHPNIRRSTLRDMLAEGEVNGGLSSLIAADVSAGGYTNGRRWIILRDGEAAVVASFLGSIDLLPFGPARIYVHRGKVLHRQTDLPEWAPTIELDAIWFTPPGT